MDETSEANSDSDRLGISRQLAALAGARARAIGRRGERFICAGDYISYFQPLFVSGNGIRHARVLEVDPSDEYPLRISTEELLELNTQVCWEASSGHPPAEKKKLRKLYTYSFVSGRIKAPTLREELGSALRASRDSAIADIFGQFRKDQPLSRDVAIEKGETLFDIVSESSLSDTESGDVMEFREDTPHDPKLATLGFTTNTAGAASKLNKIHNEVALLLDTSLLINEVCDGQDFYEEKRHLNTCVDEQTSILNLVVSNNTFEGNEASTHYEASGFASTKYYEREKLFEEKGAYLYDDVDYSSRENVENFHNGDGIAAVRDDIVDVKRDPRTYTTCHLIWT